MRKGNEMKLHKENNNDQDNCHRFYAIIGAFIFSMVNRNIVTPADLHRGELVQTENLHPNENSNVNI